MRRRRHDELTTRDYRILDALNALVLLTPAQLLRILGLSPRSVTHLQEQLKRLFDLGYCTRRLLAAAEYGGAGVTVYWLTGKGHRRLCAFGLGNPLVRFRRAEETRKRVSNALHTLACSEVVIAAHLLNRNASLWRLGEFQPERLLRKYAKVVTVDGARVRVIPDAWFTLVRLYGRLVKTYPVIVEVDRGTTGKRAWLHQVAARVQWLEDGLYRQQFNTRAGRIAVVATPGSARAAQLQSWTHEGLQRIQRGHRSWWFRITGMDAGTVDAETFFLGAHWLVPGEEKPVRLYEAFPGSDREQVVLNSCTVVE